MLHVRVAAALFSRRICHIVLLTKVWWDNGVAVAWFSARRRERLSSAQLVIGKRILEAEMKAFIGFAAVLIVLAAATAADAKGCLKGAAVGGVAGHYSGHHGLLGAAAGSCCAIGRHEANKRDRMQRSQMHQPDRDLRNGEERL